MALSIYSPPFTSNSVGEIKGETQQVGLEDHLEWFGFTHEIKSPRDAASGLATGKRRHRPFIVTKLIDRATPLLEDTLTRNGTIDEIKFLFFRPDVSGEETHYFTITLNDATISGIRMEQLNNKYPENMPLPPFENVAFTYDKITWEEVIHGTMAYDSWKSSRRRS